MTPPNLPSRDLQAASISGPLPANFAINADSLERRRAASYGRVHTDEALQAVFDRFDDVADDLERTKHVKWRSPRFMISLAAAEGFLKGYMERYIAMAGIATTQDEMLCRPPSFSVADDRRFWKALCSLVATRSAKCPNATYVKGSERSVSSVIGDMHSLYTSYEVLTGLRVSKDLRDECNALNKQRVHTPAPREKQQANFKNIFTIIKKGVFSPQVRMRVWRERLQCTLLLLLLAYTAARPGEIVRNPNYVDALRWKDITFVLSKIIKEDGTVKYRLACDIKLRNLKGMRQKITEFRTQPLYMDDSLPYCMDATALLAMLAIEDGLFLDINIASIIGGQVGAAISSLFPEDTESVEIPVATDVTDTFVFRRFEASRLDSDKAADGSKLSKSVTTTSSAWDYAHAKHQVSKSAAVAGFPGFHFYTVRYASSNLLNKFNVGSNNTSMMMGHRPHSSTFFDYYLSKRSVVDLQGLVSLGHEQRDVIAEHGLRRCVERQLTPAEKQGVETHPLVSAARQLVSQAQQDCDALMAQTIPDAPNEQQQHQLRIDNLLKQVKVKQNAYLRTRVYHINVLKAAVSKRVARDETLAVLEAASAQPVEETARLLAAGLEEDELLDSDADLLVAEEFYEDDESSVRWIEGLEQELDTNEEDGIDRDHRDLIPSALAVRLRDEFSRLAEAHTAEHDGGSFFDPLFAVPSPDKPRIDFATAFELFRSSKGTYNGAVEERAELGSCPTCSANFDNGRYKSYGTFKALTAVNSHIEFCAKSGVYEEYDEACLAALKGQRCPHASCMRKKAVFETDLDALKAHLIRHRKRVNTGECRFTHEDGRLCSFEVLEEEVLDADSEDAHIGALWRHAEEVHGFPFAFASVAAVLCSAHHTWCFGIAQIEEHHGGHVLAAPSERDHAWVNMMCQFCLGDTRLPMSFRGQVYKNRHLLAKHTLKQHVLPIRTREVVCPSCDTSIFTPDFAKHLLHDHGLNLFTQDAMTDDGSNLKALVVSTTNKEKQAFIDFASSLSLARDVPPSPSTSSASRTLQVSVGGRFRHARVAADRCMGCPFCNYNEELSEADRQRFFHQTQKQASHIVAHLTAATTKMQECPQCKIEIHAAEMPSHLESHGYNVSGKINVKVGGDLTKIKGSGSGPRKRWLEWIDADCPEDANKKLKQHHNAGPGRAHRVNRKLGQNFSKLTSTNAGTRNAVASSSRLRLEDSSDAEA